MNQYDVIVLGSGFSGCAAAIAAKEAGYSVVILEKAPQPGGISICSAGGVRVAQDKNDALTYLLTTNGGKTPIDVQETYVEKLCKLEPQIKALGKGTDAVIAYHHAPGNYPLPGYKTFGFVTVDELPGVDLAKEFPHVKGNKPQGMRLYYLLNKRVKDLGIPILIQCGGHNLIKENDRICGVVTTDGRIFKASAKVILACGGFEAAPDIQNQYWPGGMAYSAAFRYNTGDGLRMAMSVGADIWHMWHFHGCYGFEPPMSDYPFGIHVKRLPDWIPTESTDNLPKMSWILLDQYGHRFTNEYQPYFHDTGARDLAVYDTIAQRYSRNPCWLITDKAGLAMYPLGKPLYNDALIDLAWSEDNMDEVKKGWILEATNIDELATKTGLPACTIEVTLSRWNEACSNGIDQDFGRPSTSMHPIAKPPFYAAKMTRVVTNTQGGPRRDCRQRVLNPYGEPIRGLYAVGECGSLFGHLYLIGGNLAECFISGQIAGEDDASL